jgi:hypothetical protein
MSRGKYSPKCPHANSNYDYKYNCFGKIPEHYNGDKTTFCAKIHMDGYDDEGFDRYGYSDFLADGTYVGLGCGVDRNGHTEDEYLSMNDDQFFYYYNH